MFRLHLTRTLRTLAFFALWLVVLVGAASLWWVNHTGLPQAWREAVERQIAADHGLNVKIGSLSYWPLRGVAASDVAWFSDPACQQEISRVERMLLDIDTSGWSRREFRLKGIQFRNARLVLPMNPDAANPEPLSIHRVHGTLRMPGNRRLEISELRGKVAGVEVVIQANLIGYRADGKSKANDQPTSRNRQPWLEISRELQRWRFDPLRPPVVRLQVEGDLNTPESLHATIAVDARSLEKNQRELRSVRVRGTMTGRLFTVSECALEDDRGQLQARFDYDIAARDGRFWVESSLDLPAGCNAWLGRTLPGALLIGGKHIVQASGEFHCPKGEAPQVRMTGHFDAESVLFRGVTLDRAKAKFAWNRGELFLREIHLTRPDGEASGKLLYQAPRLRLAVDATFPVHTYLPLVSGQPLEKVINHFAPGDGAAAHLWVEGGLDLQDPRRTWAFTGGGALKRMRYRGVPFVSAECRLALSHHALDFYDGRLVFDYRDDPLRSAYGGPQQGTANVGRIRYDAASKLVAVEQVQGAIWAAPLVRLFAPKIATGLEVYRFQRPPQLSGDGVVDVTPQGRTSLDIDFSTQAAADYRFLGEMITLASPSGRVRIRGNQVTVDGLRAGAFDGSLQARFETRPPNKLLGEVSWTKLALPGLAKTYGFKMEGGSTTGRMAFDLDPDSVRTMRGEGLFALEQTQLFAVPIFGPLSPLISGVLNNQKAGFEHARDAFCTFRIVDGVLETRDFRTETKSLSFQGEGKVDLAERTLDMTMTMDAQGLLGLITLPLRPLYGLFEFRGTGPLRQPDWENVVVTPGASHGKSDRSEEESAPRATPVQAH